MSERLHELSSERSRFGYRRLHVLLTHIGRQINHKKLWRIYKEEGLSEILLAIVLWTQAI
ncbi:MAG: transposase [Rhizobiales bacterium]|nr:transposase [Hyphomicrobiales bacterium]